MSTQPSTSSSLRCPFHHGESLMTNQTVNIIKQTCPVVAPLANEITKTFYPLMFKNNPEALEFFNETNQKRGRQPQALANSVVAYASNIEHLENLTEAIDIIAHKHCGLNVLPEHYPIVHKNMMMAIGQVLGAAATPEIANAWSEAVLGLAHILITREKELYDDAAAKNGGWRGWRKFNVVEKTEVATDMFMYTFKPLLADGEDPAAVKFDFTPGQFLSVHFPSGIHGNPRHYTVVSEPGADHLSIIVKRIHRPHNLDVPDGHVSNLMADGVNVGDVVELTPPFGYFTITTPPTKPVLLLSAGVGVTPAIAFLKQCKRMGYENVISVHQDHTKDTHAFAPFFEENATHSFARYSREDSKWRTRGHVDLEDLRSVFATSGAVPEQTEVYLCGPERFMNAMNAHLKALGVNTIHTEVFGPTLAAQLG